MIPNAFRILQQYYIEFHSNASVTHFRILSTCVNVKFQGCIHVKKWLRKTPLKIKFVRKKYNGENGLQRKAILCGGIPGKIKNISDRNILSTTNQMNILAGNLQ